MIESVKAQTASHTGLRTNYASGIITGVLGVLMSAFGTFALLMVLAQRLLFSSMPPMPEDPEVQVRFLARTLKR